MLINSGTNFNCWIQTEGFKDANSGYAVVLIDEFEQLLSVYFQVYMLCLKIVNC